jgi:hypothetical protein
VGGGDREWLFLTAKHTMSVAKRYQALSRSLLERNYKQYILLSTHYFRSQICPH